MGRFSHNRAEVGPECATSPPKSGRTRLTHSLGPPSILWRAPRGALYAWGTTRMCGSLLTSRGTGDGVVYPPILHPCPATVKDGPGFDIA